MSPTSAVPHAHRLVRSPRSIAVEDLRRCRIGPLPPRRHHAANPRRRTREAGGTCVAQIRQLEMRVRVDEAGQHGDVAEIDLAPRRGRADRPRRPSATMRPRSTATQPSRIGGAAIGRIQAAW